MTRTRSVRNGKGTDRQLVTTPTLWDVLDPTQPEQTQPSKDAESTTVILANPIIGPVTDMNRLMAFYDGTLPQLQAPSLNDEAAFRRRIIAEAHDGQIALDGLYLRVGSQAHVGHVPEGQLIDRSRWIARHHDLTWEIPLDALPVREQLEREAEKQHIPMEAISDQLLQTTVIDVAERLVGAYAARVMHGLYQAANDCWRTPIFRLDLNAFLTLMGLKPDKLGYHRGEARAELRDTLQALQAVNLMWEGEIFEGGERIFRQIQRPLINILATDYRERENPGKERRRPSHVIIALGWYQGVRRPDGRPGTDYIRIQRLRPGLGNAAHHRTDDALGRRLLMIARYRLTELERRKVTLDAGDTIGVTLTRKVALERAGITTTNVTWQRKTLEKALQKLMLTGIVVAFDPIPAKPAQSFAIQVAVAPLMSITLSSSDEESLHEEQEAVLASVAEDEDEGAHDDNVLQLREPAVPNWPPVPPPSLQEQDGGGVYAQESNLGAASTILAILRDRLQTQSTILHHLLNMQACWRVMEPVDEFTLPQTSPTAFMLLTNRGVDARGIRRYLRTEIEPCLRTVYGTFPPVEVLLLPPKRTSEMLPAPVLDQ
ncbi:MAG: hypothetical protein H0X24_20260 [Ktedonobacterales bacterium]|nr:hypothetical protein [Ktedonobacterales bacterium]